MSGGGSARNRWQEWAHSGVGYHVLLAFLFWMLLVQPGWRAGADASLLGEMVTIGVFAAALFAVAENRTVLILGAALLLPAVVLTGMDTGGSRTPALSGQGFSLAFILLISGTFLRRIFSHESITGATLSAAACVYLFLGIAWSYAYQILVALDPGALAGLDGPAHELFYFSFVTLTTLGFGDITPVSQAARALVTVEALVGQLYLVITIARLVTLYGHRVNTGAPGEATPDPPPGSTGGTGGVAG